MQHASSLSQKPIRIIQITDSHLFVDSGKTLLGLNTEASFNAVVQLAFEENRDHNVRLILATGDIAQDSTQQAYQYYNQAVQCFDAEILWLPGNHDESLSMKDSLSEFKSKMSPCVHHIENWSFIMLDSSVSTEVYGYLEKDQLEFLIKELGQIKSNHVMICMHHHPILCGSAWLDEHNLKNSEAFWSIVEEFKQVKSVVWGHIHQEFEAIHHLNSMSISCYAPPSTCIQFKPQSHDFALDTLHPGYRWFDLYPDGRIETQVSRVTQKFDVDMNSKGY